MQKTVAAVDDEPRTADALVLRGERNQSLHTSWRLRVPKRRLATGILPRIGKRQTGGASRNIADCTIVYVDESNDKVLYVALKRAARAYEGFLLLPKLSRVSRSVCPLTRAKFYWPQ